MKRILMPAGLVALTWILDGSSCALAQTLPLATTVASERDTDVAPSGFSGQALAVWRSDSRIRGEIRRSDGSTVRSGVTVMEPFVASGWSYTYSAPAVTRIEDCPYDPANPCGFYVVAKRTATHSTYGATSQIVGRYVSAGGDVSSVEQALSGTTVPAYLPGRPDVAGGIVAPGLLVVWTEGRNLMGRRANSSGIPSGAPFVIHSASGVRVGPNPAVSFGRNQYFGGAGHVAAFTTTDDFGSARMLARFVSDTGPAPQPIWVAPISATGDVGDPDVTWEWWSISVGIVAWRDGRDVYATALYDGTPVSVNVKVLATSEYLGRPAVSPTNVRGHFVLAFEQHSSPSAARDLRAIRLRATLQSTASYPPSYNLYAGAPMTLANTTNNEQQAAVAWAGDRLLTTWESENPTALKDPWGGWLPAGANVYLRSDALSSFPYPY